MEVMGHIKGGRFSLLNKSEKSWKHDLRLFNLIVGIGFVYVPGQWILYR